MSTALLKALVLRPIVRERMRTLLTLAGIAVGVAVVVAIQLANQSALRAFRDSVDAVAGRANYQLVSDSGSFDEELLTRLRPLWTRGIRFAPVIDLEGTLGTGATARPTRILGVDLLSDLHFRDYRYARIAVDGNAEARSTSGDAEDVPLDSYLSLFDGNSVVLPSAWAAEQRVDVGDDVVLSVLGRRATLKVRGLLEPEGPATAFNGAIVVCDIATAQHHFGLAGRLTRVDMVVPDDKLEAISREIPLPPGTRFERPSRRNERVERMLLSFRVNLFALAGVALLVGMFLVYNTVLISILRRRKDVGVLRTVGTSPRQIFFAFLGEGVIFGLVGSLIGVALGRLLATGILRAVGATVNTLYVASAPEAVRLTPGVVLLGLAVGTLLSAASALQPALEASRIPPASMIRAALQQRVTARLPLGIGAIACFAAAALVSRIGPIGGVAVAGYVAVLLVVAGFSLLAPAIVHATSALFAPLLSRLFGIVGRLAAVSLPASLRRTSVASAALSLAIGMMVAVALMVGSFRETVRIWVDQTVTSDLWLRPAKGLSGAQTALFPEEISAELAKVPYIDAIDRARGREFVYRDALVSIGSGDFAVSAAHGDLPMVTPRDSKRALLDAVRRQGAVVSESFSLRFDKGVGDTIELPAAGRIVTLPITGVYRDYSSDRGVIVLDRSLYVRLFEDRAINTIVIYLKEGTDLTRARRDLEARLGPKWGAFVVTNREVRTEVMRIFDQTFMITYALLGVALVVAVLGIVNTLSALILERSRELALLRVSGFAAADIRRMIVLESTLLGAASTVAGLAMGYALSWILINVINKQSFGWTIQFHTPVALIASALAITFAASCLAGIVPARLAQRVDVPSALKAE